MSALSKVETSVSAASWRAEAAVSMGMVVTDRRKLKPNGQVRVAPIAVLLPGDGKR